MPQGKRRETQQGRNWDEDTFEVVGLDDISAAAKLVFIGLLSLCALPGEGPKVQALAAEVGLSRRSVKRHLKELVDAGYIVEK